MSQPTQNPPEAFDAFVSYSRKDKVFAKSLVATLNNFKPPKLEGVARHRLRVFRDESDLVGSDYYESIGQNLARARNFILVCSPHSAQSQFVNDEIKRFLESGNASDIIPILLDGKPNNEATPEEADQKAFPPALCDALELPLAISYLGFEKGEKVDKGVRESSWYSVVASILDVSRNVLEERDRKRRRRRRNFIGSIAAAVIVALSALTLFAFAQKNEAERQRAEAERQKVEAQRQEAIAVDQRISAEARLLSSQATELLNQDESLLTRALLLAVESMRKRPSGGAASILRAGLGRIGRHQGMIDFSNNRTAIGKSSDELWSARLDEPFDSQFRVFSGEWAARVFRSDNEVARLSSEADRWQVDCDNVPSGKTVVIGENNSAGTGRRYARVRDEATGEEAFLLHDGAITACSFGREPGLVATASGDVQRELPPVPIPGDHTLRIWELPPAVFALSSENSKQDLLATAFSPAGDLLATCAFNQNFVRVFSLEDGTEVARLGLQDRDVTNLAFSPDGRFLAAAPTYGDHFEVWRIDGAEGTPRFENILSLDQYSSEGGVELSPGGKYLITDYGQLTNPQGAEIWDVATGARLSGFGSDPASRVVMTFAPGGKRLITIERMRIEEPPWSTSRLMIWDMVSREAVQVVERVQSFTVSADGKLLVLGMASDDTYDEVTEMSTAAEGTGDLQVWSMDPLRVDRVIPARASGSCMTLSPDGRYLAFCKNDKTVQTLDLASDTELHEAVYEETVGAVAFSPDAEHLATATYAYGGQEVNAFRLANVLVIRDVESGEIVTTLQHQGLINDVSFSADGRYVGTKVYLSEESGLAPAHVWMWRNDDLVAEACRSLPRNLTLEEWSSYMPAEAYRKTCEELPEHRSTRQGSLE